MIADGGADLCDVERREEGADGEGSGKEKGGRRSAVSLKTLEFKSYCIGTGQSSSFFTILKPLGENEIANANVMCTWIIWPSLNTQPDASRLFKTTGYLVFDPLRAMQMKPYFQAYYLSHVFFN